MKKHGACDIIHYNREKYAFCFLNLDVQQYRKGGDYAGLVHGN